MVEKIAIINFIVFLFPWKYNAILFRFDVFNENLIDKLTTFKTMYETWSTKTREENKLVCWNKAPHIMDLCFHYNVNIK